MTSIKFKPTISEIIGEVLGLLFIIGLLGWALVSFFPLTWGQALVISWAFNKLLDVLRALGWTDWYHPNYWVHPDLTDSSGKIDYTYLGMTLEQAIIYENSGKRK